MIKKIIFTIILSISLVSNSYSAGSSSGGEGDGPKTKTNYERAVKFIKFAKKHEEKGKKDKAKSNYEKALKLLLKSNSKKPNKPDTLNYLGFTSRKLGDFEKGEKYYLNGLSIKPNHVGINEYLGELYVATNRIDLAKERLNVLSSCNCKEYSQLKEVIEGTRKSKY